MPVDDYRFADLDRRLTVIEARLDRADLGGLVQQVSDMRGDISELKEALKGNTRVLWTIFTGFLLSMIGLVGTLLSGAFGGHP